MRVLLLVPVLALVLSVNEAAASGCFLGPFTPRAVPFGCPITIYQHAVRQPNPPVVFAMRDGTYVDLAGSMEKSQVVIGVGHPTYDCNGDIEAVELIDTAYDVYQVEVPNTFAGETVFASGFEVKVGEPGPCVALAAPQPLCGYLPNSCEDDPDAVPDDGGCSSGGAPAGLAFGLLALALAMRARR